MSSLPKNPVANLGNLPQEYDVAIRGYIQNIPEEYLQMAIEGLQEGVRQGIEQFPEEDRENQQRMLEGQLKQMESYIKESDELTIGWKTDPAAQKTYLDFNFSALPGGDLAKQMNAMANAKTDYSGFIIPDAAMSMNFSTEIPQEQLQASMDAIAGMKEVALKEIDRDDDLDEDSKTAFKELAGAAIDMFVETMKTGQMDGGASIVLGSGEMQVLSGFHVADGKDVEKVLRRVDDMTKEKKEFPRIKFNAETAAGVTYHTMTMPIPADEDDVRKIVGDSLEVAVGVADTSAYMGVGKNCVEKLKQIIATQQKQQPVMPFQMTLALTPIMEFISGIEDNPLVGSITDAVKEDDKDHVRLMVKPMENGFTYRIEMEEGILRAIGAGIKMANAGGF